MLYTIVLSFTNPKKHTSILMRNHLRFLVFKNGKKKNHILGSKYVNYTYHVPILNRWYLLFSFFRIDKNQQFIYGILSHLTKVSSLFSCVLSKKKKTKKQKTHISQSKRTTLVQDNENFKQGCSDFFFFCPYHNHKKNGFIHIHLLNCTRAL